MVDTAFAGPQRAAMVQQLRGEAIAFGLRLSAELAAQIMTHAARVPCYADRNPAQGVRVAERDSTCHRQGKPLLLCQCLNVAACTVIRQLMADPVLQRVVGSCLQSMPTHLGANLWWHFPVPTRQSDSHRRAHLSLREVDAFSFLKFCFDLIDVEPGDGEQVCVLASYRLPPSLRAGSRWNLFRNGDGESYAYYPAEPILKFCGAASNGFAGHALCILKGRTSTHPPRLLPQLPYALFDHSVLHDRRPAAAPRKLA